MLGLSPASGSSQSGLTHFSCLTHYFPPQQPPLQPTSVLTAPRAPYAPTHTSVPPLMLFPLPFPAFGVLKSSSSMGPPCKSHLLHKASSDPSGGNWSLGPTRSLPVYVWLSCPFTAYVLLPVFIVIICSHSSPHQGTVDSFRLGTLSCSSSITMTSKTL